MKVAQSCLTLCDPMVIESMEFSRPEYWSGQSFPSPGDLPNSGTEPRSVQLWVDSLLSKPPGKPNSNSYQEYTIMSISPHLHQYWTFKYRTGARGFTTAHGFLISISLTASKDKLYFRFICICTCPPFIFIREQSFSEVIFYTDL